jgi:hypothetical protein
MGADVAIAAKIATPRNLTTLRGVGLQPADLQQPSIHFDAQGCAGGPWIAASKITE